MCLKHTYTHAGTHTQGHTEDYHMGSRALGGETRRVLTLLFPESSEETRVERNKGGWVGVYGMVVTAGGGGKERGICLAE